MNANEIYAKFEEHVDLYGDYANAISALTELHGIMAKDSSMTVSALNEALGTYIRDNSIDTKLPSANVGTEYLDTSGIMAAVYGMALCEGGSDIGPISALYNVMQITVGMNPTDSVTPLTEALGEYIDANSLP